jgi:hypothetical protein
VSAVQAAATPTVPLYRIARAPNPLAWPAQAYVGSERFDDPRRRFRTLYAAEQRRACFVETLAPYRPDLRQLAAEAKVASRESPREPSNIPADWCDERRIGRF